MPSCCWGKSFRHEIVGGFSVDVKLKEMVRVHSFGLQELPISPIISIEACSFEMTASMSAIGSSVSVEVLT